MFRILHKYLALVFLIVGLFLIIFNPFEGARQVGYFIVGIAILIGTINYVHTGTPFTDSSGGH